MRIGALPTPVRALSAGRSCLIEPASPGSGSARRGWPVETAACRAEGPTTGWRSAWPTSVPGATCCGFGNSTGCRPGRARWCGRHRRAARGPSVGRHRPRPSRELRRGPGRGGCTGFRSAPLRAVYGVCEWYRPEPVRPGRTRGQACQESGPPLWLTASLRAWRPPASGPTPLRDRQPEASPPARAHAPASQPRNGTGSGWR